MTQEDLTNAVELGLAGLVLLIITAPVWLTVWAWRAINRNEY